MRAVGIIIAGVVLAVAAVVCARHTRRTRTAPTSGASRRCRSWCAEPAGQLAADLEYGLNGATLAQAVADMTRNLIAQCRTTYGTPP